MRFWIDKRLFNVFYFLLLFVVKKTIKSQVEWIKIKKKKKAIWYRFVILLKKTTNFNLNVASIQTISVNIYSNFGLVAAALFDSLSLIS